MKEQGMNTFILNGGYLYGLIIFRKLKEGRRVVRFPLQRIRVHLLKLVPIAKILSAQNVIHVLGDLLTDTTKKIAMLGAWATRLHSTSGGSSDTEANELQVNP